MKGRKSYVTFSATWGPAADVYEDDKEIRIVVDIAGVDPDQLWRLVGQIEVLPQMENTLHSYLKKRLKRTFRIDLNSDPEEVLDKTLELEREVKKEEDQSLVSRLMNSLKSDRLGVTGIHETLSSLYEGKRNGSPIIGPKRSMFRY